MIQFDESFSNGLKPPTVSPEGFQPPSFSQESMEVDEFHESGHLLIRRQWCQAWLKMPWCPIKSHPFKLFWEGRSHHCWDIPMWFDVLEVDGMECRVDIRFFSYQDHVQSEDSKLFFIGSFPLASSLVISWSMWKTVTSTRRGNCYGQFRRKGEHIPINREFITGDDYWKKKLDKKRMNWWTYTWHHTNWRRRFKRTINSMKPWCNPAPKTVLLLLQEKEIAGFWNETGEGENECDWKKGAPKNQVGLVWSSMISKMTRKFKWAIFCWKCSQS